MMTIICPFCKSKEERKREIAGEWYCKKCGSWVKLGQKQNTCLDCNKKTKFMELIWNNVSQKNCKHYFTRCDKCQTKWIRENII